MVAQHVVAVNKKKVELITTGGQIVIQLNARISDTDMKFKIPRQQFW